MQWEPIQIFAYQALPSSPLAFSFTADMKKAVICEIEAIAVDALATYALTIQYTRLDGTLITPYNAYPIPAPGADPFFKKLAWNIYNGDVLTVFGSVAGKVLFRADGFKVTS